MIIGGGLGLLVPPLTATLLGSVETSRSGIAAGVLNATRQTGSVLGVALFGSLVGQPDAFMRGAFRAYVETRPGMKEYLEELQLITQLEELRKTGNLGSA